ncbi:hypothetical protein RJ639_034602 [Escallonia herrerae]|uniref:E2F/DP family winged-helix DNA-binding domain-containing protein n=1 Tax=Escallonia herrerae TaxID=1293975 RepID=A0AA88WXF5_9ASTE|nr:hypothetical protein RJ639_034602 [Escallonia herrerae]
MNYINWRGLSCFANFFLSDNRKEKSLGLLTQNFIKLFLCSNMDIISLDEAAKILLGDARDPSTTRTKVRRLYDIANVLSSMKFIEKTHHPETRKSGFRWLGMSGRSQSGPANTLATDETKKRTFGTDLTNTSFKRSKLASPYGAMPYQVVKPQSQMQVKCEIFEEGVDRSNLDQKVKNHQFGPFAPLNVPKVGAAEHNKVKQVHDWESLASTFCPQYHNQGLKDLFGHYMEAWKSWYSEVAGKNPVQLIS